MLFSPSNEPNTVSHPPVTESRVAFVRRLYAYGISLISYFVVLFAVDALVNLLADVWFTADSAFQVANIGAYYRDSLASNGGLLLVASPIFLLHWRYAQSLARKPGEAGAGMRKFYLYVTLATAVIFSLVHSFNLINGLGILAVGGRLETSAIWPSGWFHALVMLGIGLLLARYFLHILRNDGDYAHEEGMAGFWRRFYQTAAGLVSLSLVLFGTASIINTLWRLVTSSTAFTAGDLWWRVNLVEGFSGLLLGGLLLRYNWLQWQAIARENPAELGRGLRRFYLYGAVVIGALVTLVPAAGLLEELLLILFGVGMRDIWAMIDGLGDPLSLIPLGLAVWVWHWRYLRREEAQSPQTEQAATIRRLYYYAVAATGLVLLWVGAVEVVQAGLDRLLVFNTPNASSFWVEGLARGLSLLAVGAPIWAFHWRAIQSIARRDDAAGLVERASGPRRVYLYGVALVGALLILFYLAQVAYRLFLLLLGDPDAGLFSPQAAGDIARSLIAATLWTIHVLAIRDDGRQGADAPEAEPAFATESLNPITRRADLETRITRLEAELAAARAELRALEETT